MLVIKIEEFGSITNGEFYRSYDNKYRIMREPSPISSRFLRWVLRDTSTNHIVDAQFSREDIFRRNNVRFLNATERNSMIIPNWGSS